MVTMSGGLESVAIQHGTCSCLSLNIGRTWMRLKRIFQTFTLKHSLMDTLNTEDRFCVKSDERVGRFVHPGLRPLRPRAEVAAGDLKGSKPKTSR